MKRWKKALLIIGILLEIISIGGFAYILSIIPGPELKAMLFLSAPIAGMLYGIFVLWIASMLENKNDREDNNAEVH